MLIGYREKLVKRNTHLRAKSDFPFLFFGIHFRFLFFFFLHSACSIWEMTMTGEPRKKSQLKQTFYSKDYLQSPVTMAQRSWLVFCIHSLFFFFFFIFFFWYISSVPRSWLIFSLRKLYAKRFSGWLYRRNGLDWLVY